MAKRHLMQIAPGPVLRRPRLGGLTRFLDGIRIRARLQFRQCPLQRHPGPQLAPEHSHGQGRRPQFVQQRLRAFGRHKAVPSRQRRILGQQLQEAMRAHRIHVLLHALEVGHLELRRARRQHACDAQKAVRRRPLIRQLLGIAFGQDLVIGRRNEVPARIEALRQIVHAQKTVPLELAGVAWNRQQSRPVLADGSQPRRDPPDVARPVGIHQVLRRNFVTRHFLAELRPVGRARHRQGRQIPRAPRLRPHPSQRIRAVQGRILLDHRSMQRIAQFHLPRRFPLHRDRLAFHLHLLPRPAIPVLRRVRRLQLFHVQVLLVDAHDGEPVGDLFVVPQRHPRQCRLARAHHVPPRRHQMHGLAQRRHLNRPVRIVRQNGLASRRHLPVHHPVVAALLARKQHRTDGRRIIPQNVRSDGSQVQPLRRIQRAERVRRHHALNGGNAELRNVHRALHLAPHIAGH